MKYFYWGYSKSQDRVFGVMLGGSEGEVRMKLLSASIRPKVVLVLRGWIQVALEIFEAFDRYRGEKDLQRMFALLQRLLGRGLGLENAMQTIRVQHPKIEQRLKRTSKKHPEIFVWMKLVSEAGKTSEPAEVIRWAQKDFILRNKMKIRGEYYRVGILAFWFGLCCLISFFGLPKLWAAFVFWGLIVYLSIRFYQTSEGRSYVRQLLNQFESFHTLKLGWWQWRLSSWMALGYRLNLNPSQHLSVIRELCENSSHWSEEADLVLLSRLEKLALGGGNWEEIVRFCSSCDRLSPAFRQILKAEGESRVEHAFGTVAQFFEGELIWSGGAE